MSARVEHPVPASCTQSKVETIEARLPRRPGSCPHGRAFSLEAPGPKGPSHCSWACHIACMQVAELADCDSSTGACRLSHQSPFRRTGGRGITAVGPPLRHTSQCSLTLCSVGCPINEFHLHPPVRFLARCAVLRRRLSTAPSRVQPRGGRLHLPSAPGPLYSYRNYHKDSDAGQGPEVRASVELTSLSAQAARCYKLLASCTRRGHQSFDRGACTYRRPSLLR